MFKLICNYVSMRFSYILWAKLKSSSALHRKVETSLRTKIKKSPGQPFPNLNVCSYSTIIGFWELDIKAKPVNKTWNVGHNDPNFSELCCGDITRTYTMGLQVLFSIFEVNTLPKMYMDVCIDCTSRQGKFTCRLPLFSIYTSRGYWRLIMKWKCFYIYIYIIRLLFDCTYSFENDRVSGSAFKIAHNFTDLYNKKGFAESSMIHVRPQHVDQGLNKCTI